MCKLHSRASTYIVCIKVFLRKLRSAQPTKLISTLIACHMIASIKLLNWRSAFIAFLY